jgi:hypothetical protein
LESDRLPENRAKAAAWRARHAEAIKAYQHAYMARWRREHLEKVRAYRNAWKMRRQQRIAVA